MELYMQQGPSQNKYGNLVKLYFVKDKSPEYLQAYRKEASKYSKQELGEFQVVLKKVVLNLKKQQLQAEKSKIDSEIAKQDNVISGIREQKSVLTQQRQQIVDDSHQQLTEDLGNLVITPNKPRT